MSAAVLQIVEENSSGSNEPPCENEVCNENDCDNESDNNPNSELPPLFNNDSNDCDQRDEGNDEHVD